jgi:DNA-directed RNA polymerase specialized sigma subunit
MTVADFKEDLSRIGRNNPELLVKKLEQVGLNKQELSIMKLRYIDGLFIKQIPEYVQAEERWVKKLHARAIIKTLDGLHEVDLVEMGIHHKATLRTLYQA